jgi:hypothetical protein
MANAAGAPSTAYPHNAGPRLPFNAPGCGLSGTAQSNILRMFRGRRIECALWGIFK